MLSIAVSAFGDFSILGLSIRNIISILIVLVLGWRNGILVGTTAGVTIGITLGIIAQNEPLIVAVYAISGMFAGILNKFGKIGVIIGFIIGNGILIYASKGTAMDLVVFKEVLIASLGLLAIPKWAGIDIEGLVPEETFFPEFNNRRLTQSKETINQLNVVSETIKDMAETYNDEDQEDKKQEMKEKNKKTFVRELLNNLDGLEENIFYEDMSNPESKIVDELFKILLDKQEIDKNDLLETFAKFNNYIVTFENEKLSQYMEKEIFNENEWRDLFNLIYFGHYAVSKEQLQEGIQYYNTHANKKINQLEDVLDNSKEHYQRLIERLTFMKPEAKKLCMDNVKKMTNTLAL